MQNPPRQIRANCGAAPPAANLCTARERPRLPLRGLAFERRQWRMQRERQAAAVREREIAKPKRERRAAREQSWILLPLCGNKRLRERYTKAARKQYVQACTKVIGAASRLPCARFAPSACRTLLGSPVQGELSRFSATEGLYPRPVIAFTPCAVHFSAYPSQFSALLCDFLSSLKIYSAKS